MTVLIGVGRALPLVQARPSASGTAAGYAVIRRYHVKTGAAGEIAHSAQEVAAQAQTTRRAVPTCLAIRLKCRHYESRV